MFFIDPIVCLASPQFNSLGVRERLPCLLSVEPAELLVEPSEALRITTEAYRLWAVAAAYGQACQLYMQVNTFTADHPGQGEHGPD